MARPTAPLTNDERFCQAKPSADGLNFFGIQFGIAIIVNNFDGVLECEVDWKDRLASRAEDQKFGCFSFPLANDLDCGLLKSSSSSIALRRIG
jgi:hypothetical protein